MSGTSLDGLDIVAVEFHESQPELLHQQTIQYPPELRSLLQQLALNPDATINEMCILDTQLGNFYAEKINHFIDEFNINRQEIVALGSHGQTIRHDIQQNNPYTLQIGDPNIIAAQSGITVVADFRRRDLALGGQGAPLAPAFHNHAFHSDKTNRVIINIGGIANITYLPANNSTPICGFDTGPGNTLLDSLSQQFLNKNFDERGEFARSGEIQTATLQEIIEQEPYFHKKPPKSTGTDYFSPAWLKQFQFDSLSPSDIMATLVELTALSLVKGIQYLESNIDEFFVCGGGAHNNYLMERLSHHLKPGKVKSTISLGIHPDWVEAMAFAWLARQTIKQLPGNLPSVTSAKTPTILGGVYFSHRQA
jgi:anhydro-N-acetylmuramic acid kinase